MAEAVEASGLPTKRAIVDQALRLLVQMHAQRELLAMAGKVEFFDNYDPEEGGDDERDEWDDVVA